MHGSNGDYIRKVKMIAGAIAIVAPVLAYIFARSGDRKLKGYAPMLALVGMGAGLVNGVLGWQT
jgi:hypothetical protein